MGFKQKLDIISRFLKNRSTSTFLENRYIYLKSIEELLKNSNGDYSYFSEFKNRVNHEMMVLLKKIPEMNIFDLKNLEEKKVAFKFWHDIMYLFGHCRRYLENHNREEYFPKFNFQSFILAKNKIDELVDNDLELSSVLVQEWLDGENIVFQLYALPSIVQVYTDIHFKTSNETIPDNENDEFKYPNNFDEPRYSIFWFQKFQSLEKIVSKREKLCCICKSAKPDTLFEPCHHQAMCSECFESYGESESETTIVTHNNRPLPICPICCKAINACYPVKLSNPKYYKFLWKIMSINRDHNAIPI